MSKPNVTHKEIGTSAAAVCRTIGWWPKVTRYWRDVTCKNCLKLRPKK